jgi:hypothetical protein
MAGLLKAPIPQISQAQTACQSREPLSFLPIRATLPPMWELVHESRQILTLYLPLAIRMRDKLRKVQARLVGLLSVARAVLLRSSTLGTVTVLSISRSDSSRILSRRRVPRSHPPLLPLLLPLCVLLHLLYLLHRDKTPNWAKAVGTKSKPVAYNALDHQSHTSRRREHNGDSDDDM